MEITRERNGSMSTLFKEGDFIYYGSGGLCRIDSICEMPFEGARADVPYYILHTLSEPKQTILNPIDNEKVLMRAVMTKAEAEAVLCALPALEPFEAPNSKLLREKYIAAVKSASPMEWGKILRTYETRRRASELRLARVTEAERNFHTQALSLLCAELSLVLDRPFAEISSLIATVLRES